jgi:glycosyltransferase involved in cell wall biosynthesis
MSIDNTQKPLVSICCVTYNHENFISQCLDGFVMQQTTFPFEILIHEDASTDNTANIIKEYETQYPHLFRCVYQTINQFAIQNTLINILFPMAKGKYIAMCEGDDYWTDPLKLQKQVDFLELNPEYSVCHHACKIFNEENQQFSAPDFTDIPLQYDIEFLSKRNTIGTLTVMYRNQLSLPLWFSKLNYGDYPQHLFHALFGKIKYFTDEMAVYRRHKLSVTGSFNSIEGSLFLIKSLEILFESLTDDKIVNKNLGLQILNLYMSIFYHYHFLKDNLNANDYFNKIRSLKNLFQEEELNRELLIQIYLYRIKDFTQLKHHEELVAAISDFQDETLRYLLQEYTKEVGLSHKLIQSTSYKLGNRLIAPLSQISHLFKVTNKSRWH